MGLFGAMDGSVRNLHLEIATGKSMRTTQNSGGGIAGTVGYLADQNGRTGQRARIENCSVAGAIAGGSTMGGIAGVACAADIINCYTNCTITAIDCSGGIAGLIYGRTNLATGATKVTDCYARGSVTNTRNYNSDAGTGGLFGQTNYSGANGYVTVQNCYAAVGITVANTRMGGLVGRFTHGGNVATAQERITNCYYDSSVSGTVTQTFGSATNAAMLTQANYADWDFEDTWLIEEGEYPILRWSLLPGIDEINDPVSTPTPTPTSTANATATTTLPTIETPTDNPTPGVSETPVFTTVAPPVVSDSPSPTPSPTIDLFKLGDADCDGRVNVDDILLVRDVIFGQKSLMPQGRANLLMKNGEKPNIDHILLIRDVIFGLKN